MDLDANLEGVTMDGVSNQVGEDFVVDLFLFVIVVATMIDYFARKCLRNLLTSMLNCHSHCLKMKMRKFLFDFVGNLTIRRRFLHHVSVEHAGLNAKLIHIWFYRWNIRSCWALERDNQGNMIRSTVD